MRIVNPNPTQEAEKQICCPSCGITIAYYPIEVLVLWSRKPPAGRYVKGFYCPMCGKQVITESW